MKKRKLHFLKLGILFFGISLLLLNCIDENNIDLNENLSIEQVNDFQSIETDEAKNLINNIVTKNKNQFQKGGFSVTIDEKSLYFSEVKKTNLNIPTFSASVKPNIHSKVFMVKKQDSVYTCLYNYIPFENKNADFLSGAIIISTIDGAFINGYKVIDGVFVSQYKQETNRETAPKTFRKDAEPNDDWWDLGSLEEISLTLSGVGGGSIVFTNSHDPVSNQGWMNLNLSGSLFGGAGGGNPNGGNGGSSNSGEMPLFPCDNPTPRGCEEEEEEEFLNQNVWNSQNPYDDWNRLTDCEKDFFTSNPSTVSKAIENRKKAKTAAYSRFNHCKNTNGNTTLHNNIGDAYRHAYFSALNTKSMGYTNASSIGNAHECDTPTSELSEKVMDLKNNSWGYNYSLTHGSLTETQFFQDFTTANNNGKIKTLNPCN